MNTENLKFTNDLTIRRDLKVFNTVKSLHERFTPKNSEHIIIFKCGCITPKEFSATNEKLLLPDIRCLDLNERILLHRHYDSEESKSRKENKKLLEQEHDILTEKKHIAAVGSSTSYETNHNSKQPEKVSAIPRLNKSCFSPESLYYDASLSSNLDYKDKFKSSLEHNSTYSSECEYFDIFKKSNKFCDKNKYFIGPSDSLHSYNSEKCDLYQRLSKNDFSVSNTTFDGNRVIGRSALFKHPRNRHSKRRAHYFRYLKFPTEYKDFKNRRLLKNSASPYHYSSQNKSLYKWKKQPVTKEQLDNELDCYMSKFKARSSAINNTDPFVEEYRRETEKMLKQTDFINTLD